MIFLNPQLTMFGRKYQRQTGTSGIAEVVAVSNSPLVSNRIGYIHVRDAGGFESGGSTIYPEPYPVRIDPGVAQSIRPGRKVYIKEGNDGALYASGNVWDDLVHAGIDPAQYNYGDDRAKFYLLEHLVDGNTFPNGGTNNWTVRVFPAHYSINGQFFQFNGDTSVDLESCRPTGANTQVVVATWVDETGTVQVTCSNPVSTATNLKTDTAAGDIYVNQCITSAARSWVGSRTIILKDTDTGVTPASMYRGIRGILGGRGTGNSLQTITSTHTIPSGHNAWFIGPIRVDGTITVEGTVNIL